MTLFHIGFLEITIIDIIDIALVAYFFYRLLLLLRGARSLQLLISLLFFFTVGLVAYWLELSMVKWFISNIAAVGIIIIVVILQPELRRAFARLGQNNILRMLLRSESRNAIDEIARALDKLSDMHHGALIVMENTVKLSTIIESGKLLNATVSQEIIQSIFTPYTPLHDGAVIIKGDQVIAASCTLPLSQNIAYHRLHGMRHKAAVGVTEETDALAIIVSEETGQISYAFKGKLFRDVRIQELVSIIKEIFVSQ
ncbi:MAG: diadenylate cyclase CdaA [candidate division Zixibacteria bacterium]|nr:diadenylate cyclase CdaA [candidate division Zixibacteria bacterium]